jgi:hypothetical protein
VLVCLAGCTTIQVGVDYDRNQDFGGYLTYDWAAVNDAEVDPRIDNDLLRKRLFSAVDTELAGLGFVRSGESPDFWLGWHATVESRVDVRELGSRYGYGRGGWYDGHTQVRHYDEGTLILDVVDAERNELVWRGTAKGEVDWFAEPEEKEARLQEAVQRLLAHFPPNRSD